MRIKLFTLLAPFLAACAVQATDGRTGQDGDRGGLGKADIIGSCNHPLDGLCGGMGTGNCYCDDACVDFGDCCSDAGEVCGVDVPEPDGDPCGGLAGLSCDDGEFCNFAVGDSCGAADQLGSCEAVPEVCIQLFAPVCGCDGNTYSNSCHAAGAGTSVASEGECDIPPGGFCGGIASIECPEGQVCVDDGNDNCLPELGGADCGGVCILDSDACSPVLCELFCEDGFATDEDGCEVCACAEPVPECSPVVCQLFCEDGFETDEDGCEICSCVEPDPCKVAGCSSEMCVAPDGPDVSICIWEPEFACLPLSNCGLNGEGDTCGWEQTPEYLECISSIGE